MTDIKPGDGEIRVVMLTTDARECWKEYDKVQPYFGAAPEALLEAVPRFSNVEMHVVCCWQKPMMAPKKLADNVWFHGLLVPKIGWAWTGFQGCVRASRKKIAELKPDIVHGQGTERDCAISAVFSGRPNVVTIHGNINAMAKVLNVRFGTYLWGIAQLENFTLKRAGGVFCNSAYTEALVRPRTTRTWRVPNAIRSIFFSESGTRARSEKPIIVNVGFISERKRQLELLRLAKRLHRDVDFELWFIGKPEPSPYADQFLQEIRTAEAAGYARHLGTRSAEELVRTFDSAHAMIHYPTEEAFGLVVAEALARNLKFFGAKLGGIVDIAANVDGAELIDADDWDGLANAIRTWIRAGFPRAQSARPNIRERYHPDIVMQQHVAIYNEVLRNEPTGPARRNL